MELNKQESFKFYQLKPVVSDWIKKVCSQDLLLTTALENYGSPINIHHVPSFKNNLLSFKSIFDSFGLKNKIYFARKANKIIAFPEAAFRLNEGIDTASYRELAQCLEAGIHSKNLLVTAAVKTKILLALALDKEVAVVLDNWDEFHALQQMAFERNKSIPVFLRLSGFVVEGKTLHSRFGFSLEEAFEMVKNYFSGPSALVHLKFVGFHFHLNGYSIPERAEALLQTAAFIKRCTGLGVKTQILDFGGGILINYLKSEKQWSKFHKALKKSVLNQGPEITYQNDSLGMAVYQDSILNEPLVYPYYNEVHSCEFLKEVLSYKDDSGTTVAAVLKELDVEVRIEPGRSLMDQAGITVARVCFRKMDTAGNLMVGLEMNRTQLRSSSADFLLDPIHLPQSKVEEETVAGYLVGGYCLESELILKRKIAFKSMPKIGDLFVFVNTAGYMMHFYESEAHMFELAQNLIYDSRKNNLTTTV